MWRAGQMWETVFEIFGAVPAVYHIRDMYKHQMLETVSQPALTDDLLRA